MELEEFKNITVDVLKKHPLAEYIAEQVYPSSKNLTLETMHVYLQFVRRSKMLSEY